MVVQDPTSVITTKTTDSNVGLTTLIDAAGGVMSYSYSSARQKTSEQNPLGYRVTSADDLV
jgi:hypothetical protein